MNKLLLFGCVVALAASVVSGESLVVDANVPAGNIVVEKIADDTVWVHQDLRDSSRDWIYWKFRVTGAAGRSLKFRFTKSIAVGSRGPAVSTDRGKTWAWGDDMQPSAKREPQTNDHGDRLGFDWTFGAKDDEVWFAQTMPYDAADWRAFLDRHAEDRGRFFEEGVLCKSRKGRDVESARFGRLDGCAKYRIFVSSRHHCEEISATYVLEGMLEQVFAKDDLGRWLRENVEFRVVPFADKDGAVDGDQGKYRKPHDHARDYNDDRPVVYPEVRAIMKMLREWQPTVVNDYHSPWLRGNWFQKNNANEYVYQVGLAAPGFWAKQQAFGKAVERVQKAGVGYRQSDDFAPGQGWNNAANYDQGKTLIHWASGVFTNAALVSSWEIPFANSRFKTLYPADLRAFGRDVAAGYREYLDTPNAPRSRSMMSVSQTNPRYFATADGEPWIPVGCNVCFDRLYDGKEHGDEAVRANFDLWLRRFAENGGNCIRLWAGHASLEVMPDKPGVYDPEKAKTLRGIVSLCEVLGVKVKITLESFRSTLGDSSKARQPFFNRVLYAPYANNVSEFFRSEKCWQIYFGKAQYLKDLGFGDSPAVYCWELWNEINATGPVSAYGPWSDRALGELKKMFPNQLVVNNLGSFSDVSAYQHYDALAAEKDNDFMQVHRYLDAGADLDVCRGPMDVVAASAVREMLDRRPDRPAILAEVGAVKPNHTGPFAYYQQDKEGTLLHDAVFAPFFAGSAGCGQYWHWDHQYIDGNNLWWHYKRFATAIKGLDPIAEGFRPFYTESRRLRIYGLRGKKTAVVWCRDKASSWESELVKGKCPEILSNEYVPFRNCKLECYLPWEDRHVTVDAPKLPSFKRSIVVRVPADAVEGVVRPH